MTARRRHAPGRPYYAAYTTLVLLCRTTGAFVPPVHGPMRHVIPHDHTAIVTASPIAARALQEPPSVPSVRMSGSIPNIGGQPGSKLRVALNLFVVGSIVAFITSPHDIAFFALDMLGKAMKLGWRLVAFATVAQLVMKLLLANIMKVGFQVMLAGGPIRAGRSAFFGGLANAFGGLSAFCARREGLGRVADFFAKLARGCDDRMPSGSSMMDNGFGAAFSGDGANPFGGNGANPFGGDGGMDDLFGALGGGGSAGGMDDLFGALSSDMPSAASSPPPKFTASPPPGVTIKVRPPGSKPSESQNAPTPEDDGGETA